MGPSTGNLAATDAGHNRSLSSSAHSPKPASSRPPAASKKPAARPSAKRSKKHKHPSGRRHSSPRSHPSTHPTAPPTPDPTRSSSSSTETHGTPTSKPAPAPTSAPSGSFADQAFVITNQQRVAHGCKALTINAHLTAAAYGHSADMAKNNYFSHNSPNGAGPPQRIEAAGYTDWMSWGENIAYGQTSPQEVMTDWMNSPDHRANILNCGFTEIGIGYAKSPSGTPYWTQDFGHRG